MQANTLLIAIPAFNEEKSIGSVLSKLPHKLAGVKKINVVVVDDGSKDKTTLVVRQKKVRVIKHLLNRGLGASLYTAIVYSRKIRADILVTLDADGQHDPSDIARIIKPIIKRDADVVVGSRLIKKSRLMPLTRRFINLLANLFTYLLTGVWSSDSQSGFRAMSKKAIKSINLFTQRMEVSSEIFTEIKKYNLKYEEVPIRAVYTDYSLEKGQSLYNAPNIIFKLLINLFRR